MSYSLDDWNSNDAASCAVYDANGNLMATCRDRATAWRVKAALELLDAVREAVK